MEVVVPSLGSSGPLLQDSQLCPVFKPARGKKGKLKLSCSGGLKLAAASRALISYIYGFIIFYFCCACDNFQGKVLQGFSRDWCHSFPVPRSWQVFQTEGTRGAVTEAALLWSAWENQVQRCFWGGADRGRKSGRNGLQRRQCSIWMWRDAP